MFSRTATSSCGAPYGVQPAQLVAQRQVRTRLRSSAGARNRAVTACAVRRQVLRIGQGHHVAGHLAQRRLVVLDDVDAAQERLHRQAATSAGRSRRWAARGWSRRSSRRATPATTPRRRWRRRCGPAPPTAAASRVWISRCSAAYASTTRSPASRSSTSTVPDCGPLSAVRRSARRAWSPRPAGPAPRRPRRPARRDGVTSTLAASGSCSAWLIRSAATCTGSAVSSARMAISVGPASASMPTTPRSSRLAAVT